MMNLISKRTFCTVTTTSISSVRVRYAPSPTGNLHIGGLRTALYNYLFAKQNDGKFILRIEDTDKTREVPNSVENIINNMHWAGLTWDEGPGAAEKTKYGPYYQSQRLQIYEKFAKKLIENGDAYYCFCTEERLKTLRETQRKNKQVTKYDRHCKKLSDSDIFEKIRKGEKYTIRLHIPKGKTKVVDLIHGQLTFENSQLDDQVLLKSDGYPTYHLANVVDDHLMEISHVIRGEEWLTSLPKHINLYRALEFDPPQFAHLPLILSPNGGKLSKRESHVSVDYYRDKEILPAALINYIALLGWNPAVAELEDDGEEKGFSKSEIFSMEELVGLFSLNRVQKTNAKLMESKLHFFNTSRIRSQYKELEDPATPESRKNDLIQEFVGYCKKYNPDIKEQIDSLSQEKMTAIILFTKDRIKSYEDLSTYKFFWAPPDLKTEQAQKHVAKLMKDPEKTNKLFQETYDLLDGAVPEQKFRIVDIAKVCGEFLLKNKQRYNNEEFYGTLRFALSGRPTGGSATQMCEILGKSETLKRIKACCDFESFKVVNSVTFNN